MSTVRLFGWISSAFFQEETMIIAAILLVASVIIFIRSKGRHEELRTGSFMVASFCAIYLLITTSLAIWYDFAHARPNQIELAEQSTYTVNEVKEVELVVDESSPIGVTYRIANNSDKMICYTCFYWIEVEKNGVWYQLKNDGLLVGSDMIKKTTSPGAADTYTYNWKIYFGLLPEGHYRVVKEFRFDGEVEKHYMAAEFALGQRKAGGNMNLHITGNTWLEPGSEAFFVDAFFGVVLVVAVYMLYLFLFKAERKPRKAFLLLWCSLACHIPAFYFLMRCVTHDFGLGADHETRSAYFGFAGLIWALGIFFLMRAIRDLVCRLEKKEKKGQEKLPGSKTEEAQ